MSVMAWSPGLPQDHRPGRHGDAVPLGLLLDLDVVILGTEDPGR
jgi:hypothetical protein